MNLVISWGFHGINDGKNPEKSWEKSDFGHGFDGLASNHKFDPHQES